MLDGTVLVIEGRGYEPESGELVFNALATVHYVVGSDEYRIRTNAMGRGGDFPIVPVDGGFDWFIDMGGPKVRYEIRLVEGQWLEEGYYVTPDGEEMKIIELRLDRLGDTDWPAAGAVEMVD
ncbi:hypothetical protein [Sphingomicrobium astaxanthinifaciens]|uniref:hypothetical protein n=1 Tax=Sphingomicrobium astaxanthinifaciens TaxID=1227949 RepID=UPI001FCABB6E|nr:hypothetical protein [Sphingomicrobium astaxanthinifaciens]MCJ7422099.1 hypothetical protein [Sphingomicrobium astaxanthinifaciens]